jgi:predicted metal-dependent phosphoesterase TrpH
MRESRSASSNAGERVVHPASGIAADLHAHSSVSDGLMSPRELVERAAAQGVELFSLTDHDEVSGLAEAAAAAREVGLPFVPGVEISVTWASTTVHIVGLGIDPEQRALQDSLARVRSGRTERAREMAAGLAAAGIDDAYEGALRFVRNPDLISRTHFARHLVESGYCRDVREVFRKYLVAGKPGYVPHDWARLDEAVGWIVAAGGVAVLAHPGRYRVGDLKLGELVGEFCEAGGIAIEVVTSNHSPEQMRSFARMAEDMSLEASRGSDFHGPGEAENVELGQVPPLPPGLTPVWHRFT